MTTGFEEAQERRNWLERLMDKIPGFRGYQDRELRRDVDKLQREYLAQGARADQAAVRGKAQAYTDAGQIGVLHLFDRLDRRLDGLSQAIRFADYGQSGFFDVVKINEPELDASTSSTCRWSKTSAAGRRGRRHRAARPGRAAGVLRARSWRDIAGLAEQVDRAQERHQRRRPDVG